MKYLGYLFTLICAFAAVQIIVIAWQDISGHTIDVKDYLTYVQMIVTFITAVLLAMFNFSANRSNDEHKNELTRAANNELARLQSALAIETAESVEKIRAQFTTSVNDATERLRAQLNHSSEEFKARLGQTIPQKYNGYHLMFKAATKYFFAIRRFEEGIYPDKDLESAVAAADEAIGSALIVDKEDRERFFNFVTESNWHARKVPKESGSDAIKSYWSSEGKKFGGRYNELQEAFANKVQS